MKKQIISFRDRFAEAPLFWQGEKPFIPKKKSPEELFPEKPKIEDVAEKAPIAEHGVGGAAWAKLGPNLDVKYEVPSFGRGSDISVLVSGKMPYTTGHHVQFTGVLDSAGIGDIFTMDHDLVSSIRKFVYQELPNVDKFDRKILDEIYSDVMTEVGLNVPIKSIYEYLRNNYPKEFSKATGGRNVTPEQMLTLLQKQKAFYSKGRISSRIIGKTAAARGDFPKDSLVTIDFKRLDPKSKESLRQYDKNINDTTPLVYLKPKDDLRSIVIIKTDAGVLKPISLPTQALKEFRNTSNWADEIDREERDVYGRGDSEESKKDVAKNKLFAKLSSGKKLNEREITATFKYGLLRDLDEKDFMEILAGENGTTLYQFYEKNKSNVDSKTKKNFVLFKVRRGEKLSDDEVDESLKSMNKEQMNKNPEAAMVLIYHKIRNQTPMQLWEVKFLLDNDKFNEEIFNHHEQAFVDYYNYAISKNELDAVDAKLKRVIMNYKKQNNKKFSEAEENDPVYREIIGMNNGQQSDAPQSDTPQGTVGI